VHFSVWVFLICLFVPAYPQGWDIPGLIGKIAADTPVRIADNPEFPWTKQELEAVLALFDKLPPEYREMKSVTLKKTVKPLQPGHSWKDKCSVDQWGRAVELNLFYELPLPCSDTNIYLGGFFSLSIDNPVHLTNRPPGIAYYKWWEPIVYEAAADPSVVAPTVQRLLLYCMTKFLDSEHHFSDQDEWRILGRFNGLDLLGNSSENQKIEGFVCKEGMSSPWEDFATFAVEFFLPTAYPDPAMHLINRLPCKYAYFRSLFPSMPDPQKELAAEFCYSNWIDPAEVDHIELLYATPVASSAVNLAGHILLLIQKKGEGDVQGISKCISFVANVYHYGKTKDTGLLFMFRGVFGAYPSMIQEETFAEVVTRAKVIEKRHIYRIKLVLSQPEIEYLIMRMWEMRNTYSTPYLFFNRNCGTLIVDLVNEVFPAGKKAVMGEMFGMPNNLCAKLYALDRLSGFVYPEFWNNTTIARFATQKNLIIREDFIRMLKSGTLPADAGQIGMIEKLFADTVSRETNIDRAEAYEGLTDLYMDMATAYTQGNNTALPPEFLLAGRLLLKYMIYSLDRERYLGSPAVQAKLANNQIVTTVIRNIFRLRLFLIQNNADDPDPSFEIREEFENYSVEYRKKGSYVSNAYPLKITFAGFSTGGENYLSLGFKMGFLSQKMGDQGIFAMRNDVLLEIGTYEMVPYASFGAIESGFAAASLLYGSRFTLLKLEQAMSGTDVDYSGWFLPGFGFTLWDAHYNIIPGIKHDINVLDVMFSLYIFELNNFEHFLSLGICGGFSYVYDSGDNLNRYLDVTPRLEAKFYLFGNSQNIVRLTSDLHYRFGFFFEPYLGFSDIVPVVWRTDLSFSFGLGKNRNEILTAGVWYERKWGDGTAGKGFNAGEESFGISLSMKWDNFGLGIDLYHFLNTVF
jgi:hypothetical protein